MTDARSRLLQALNSSDPSASAFELARVLRDEGMGQVSTYRLYAEQHERLAGDDPRYDALADTMDCIWGGGWAKGQALFDEELTDERIRRE